MSQYTISPEDCLVLLAIRNSQTLREAARLMGSDPGGLLRKVQRIASEHDVLQKTQGKWRLTDKGLALVGWTQESILSQRKLLLSASVLRIASMSWLSERILIPETNSLKKQLGETTEVQYSVPNDDFENALTEGDCDFVVTCYPPENPIIAHKQLMPEKWSIAVSAGLGKDLSEIPLIRHTDLNPHALLPARFSEELKSSVSVDNLIGVRAALVSGLGWSLVPTALIKTEIRAGILIEIEGELKFERKICLWWLRSSSQSRKKSSLLAAWLQRACSKI